MATFEQAYRELSSSNFSSPKQVQKNKTNKRSAFKGFQYDANAVFAPALQLTPINDSFSEKKIDLFDRVKIGRQTGAKTLPTATNGYFDSKVLSRTHAEIWAENGKVFVKDVKSSNGTFVNSERLSPEGEESEAREIFSGDTLDFGIDILNEDSTVMYKRVSCALTIVSSEPPAAKQSGTENFRAEVSSPRSANRPPVPERPNESTMRASNLESAVAQLQHELTRSKATAADLEQTKKILNKISKENFEEKDSDSDAPSTSFKSNKGKDNQNLQKQIGQLNDQLQKALAETKEVQGEFEKSKTRVAKLEADLKTSENAKGLTVNNANNKKSIGGENGEQLKKEEEWSIKLASLEDRLLAYEQNNAQLKARNATLQKKVDSLEKAKEKEKEKEKNGRATGAKTVAVSEATNAPGKSPLSKSRHANGGFLSKLNQTLLGNATIQNSLPIIGISVVVGALGMWAFGALAGGAASASASSSLAASSGVGLRNGLNVAGRNGRANLVARD